MKPSKIVRILDKMSTDEVLLNMRMQNDFISKDDNVNMYQVKEIKQGKDITHTAYVELSSRVHEEILKRGKISSIGWSKCKVYDNLKVTRCFKCNAYGHGAKECHNDSSCPK